MDDSLAKRRARQSDLQQKNLSAWMHKNTLPDSKSLDANLKKNTGFIKKCKTGMNQDTAPQLLREIGILKLEKYVSEIVPAAAEGLLKCKSSSDISFTIDVISALHSRFPETFTVPFISQILKSLAPPHIQSLSVMTPEQREKEEQGRLSRQKTLLKVLGEMYICGLLWGIDSSSSGVAGLDLVSAFLLSNGSVQDSGVNVSKMTAKVQELIQRPGHSVFVGAMQNIFLKDKAHNLSLTLAIAVAKAFRQDFALSSKVDLLENSACTIPSKDDSFGAVVTRESCKRIFEILNEYCESTVVHLTTMHNTLVKMQRRNEERLFNRGMLEDVNEKLQKRQRDYDQFYENVKQLCEAIGYPIPDLENTADSKDQMGINFDGPTPASVASKDAAAGLWDDDEEKTFYESLIVLQSMVPPSFLEQQSKTVKGKRQSNFADTNAEGTDPDAQNENSNDIDVDEKEPPSESDQIYVDDINENEIEMEEFSDNEAGADDEAVDAVGILEYQQFLEKRKERDSTEALPDPSVGPSTDTDQGVGKSSEKTVDKSAASTQSIGTADTGSPATSPVNIDELLRRMPTLVNRDKIDQAAVDFCYANSKTNRAKLVRALVDLSRNQQFLLPYYSRFIATIHPYFPEVGNSVIKELVHEFNWLVKNRFKDLMDTRIKNIKYISELTKFCVAPLYVSFRCAKVLLEHFHPQNVEVLCTLLDSCGRFLLAQPETTDRVSKILAILMRKRYAINLNERIALLIDNTYYICYPPTQKRQAAIKHRTVYELYIRKLIYEDLTSSTVESVCQKLRKLPWDDNNRDDPQRVKRTLMNCFTKIWKVKYSNVYLMTMIAKLLGRLHPWFHVAIVDQVLENIRLGLERNLFSHNQRRISEVRYAAEMFVYRLIGPDELFSLLRQLLNYGHTMPYAVPGRTCELDSFVDFFRIRLVCVTLTTCGSFIARRPLKDRENLKEYMLQFQMYILSKQQPLPVDIQYSVSSLFESAPFAAFKKYESWEECAHDFSEIIQKKNNKETGNSAPTRTDHTSIPNALLHGSADGDEEPGNDNSHYMISNTGVFDGNNDGYLAEDAGFENDNDDDDYDNGDDNFEVDGNDEDDDEDEDEDSTSAEDIEEQEHQRAAQEMEEMEEARRQMEAMDALLEKEEEDLLEQKFNMMILDSIDSRKNERINALDVAIPMHLLGNLSSSKQKSSSSSSDESEGEFDDGDGSGDDVDDVDDDGGDGDGDDDSTSSDTSTPNNPGIKFSLLTGKKQRPVIREVRIPLQSQIAQKLRQQEEAELKEKQSLKRFVLNYELREDEARRQLHRQTSLADSGRGGSSFYKSRTAVPGATFIKSSSRKKKRGSNKQTQSTVFPKLPDTFL